MIKMMKPEGARSFGRSSARDDASSDDVLVQTTSADTISVWSAPFDCGGARSTATPQSEQGVLDRFAKQLLVHDQRLSELSEENALLRQELDALRGRMDTKGAGADLGDGTVEQLHLQESFEPCPSPHPTLTLTLTLTMTMTMTMTLTAGITGCSEGW